MNDHLLTTKFYPTILSQDFVLRKRLLTLLDLGLSAKLTLISAPAGFGKSSLVANWEARRNEPIAWLKLDKSDNQVSNFISYVYAALGKAYPDFDQKKLPVPDNFHEDEFIKLANLLLNEITSITKQVILVIDDYHLITNEKIHTYLEYLIEHLPPQTHIYLLSRIDPPLSLARWRARGELQEVRARDLKFKQDEINKYITQSAKFTLNTNQLSLIQEKTEGWITGIKLTVLSLSRQQDFNQLSKLLSGNQEYIADYLVDEVLSNLPEDIQSFLLQTSILTYLLADLCNTVTGLEDSQRILEKLVSENLFISALDATRSWFQYHYLFSELLRKRLYMFQRDLTATLYRRAIDWHVRRGMINEAVNYAIDMRDEKTLFSLIESNILHQILQGEFFQAQTWLAELPKELIWQQPILCLASAWINTRNLSIEQAYKFVDRAEELLRKNNSSIQITQRDKIVEHIAALRASLARTIGRPPEEQLILINKALNIISEEKKILRGLLILRKGLCYLDLEKDAEADQIFNQLIRLHIKGNYYPLYGAIYARTVIAYLQGRLHDIKDICVETLEHTENNLNNPWQKVEVQGFAYIALGMVELEWNNLENAYNYLNRGLSLNTSSGLTELQVKGQYSLGRLGIAEGKDIEPIDQSKFRGNALPHMEKFAKALQAHLWLLASNSLPQKQDAFNKAVR